MVSSSFPDFYHNDDKESFAFETCRERWPKILNDCIDDIKLALSKDQKYDASQADQIIEGFNSLIKNMANDDKLTDFPPEIITLIPNLQSFNDSLAKFATEGEKLTWLTAPWLFTECYLYRRIDALIKLQPSWKDFDIFEDKKQKSFQSTAPAVYELAKRYQSLHQESFSSGEKLNDQALKSLFKEFIDVCLWGNKIDLSLLANKSQDEVHAGQTAEKRIEAEKNIISNDTNQVWDYLVKLDQGRTHAKRMDFVLDNSGFETFTDLIFSLFLLDAQITETVVIHCKTRPWMVSDTMIKDIDILLDDLVDQSFFPESGAALQFIHSKLETYIKQGNIKLTDSEFWTIDLDYWHIDGGDASQLASSLYGDLIKSDLIFIKGDLNYRKTTADRKWDKTTPFVNAIGALSSNGLKIVSLRTCKADVCVGLPRGLDEKLSEEWHKSTGEIGGLWCSSGNWAVISFSEGNAK